MPKLDWVYFNNMFGNRIIEGATGSGSNTVDKEYPINIKESYVTDSNKECSAKCSFTFKYLKGSVSIKNVDSSHLELMYSGGRTAPVIFNGEKYNVTTIYIVTQPIHYFDGEDSKQVGEILIYHTSLEGALPLIVCIPLVSSYVGTTLGSSSLENIISIASIETAGAGDEVTVNNDNFTLNDYFPPAKTPFYSYQGNNFLGTSHISGETVHYIVYKKDSGILLNDDNNGSLTKLQNITRNSFILVDTSKDISADDDEIKEKMFINNTGALEFEGEDDIYIDCSPTGDSDNDVAFKLDANSMSGGVTAEKYEFMLTVVTRFAICIMVIVVVWYAPFYLTKMMNGGEIMKAFDQMSFGGPMDALISLQKRVKEMKQKKFELFHKDEDKNKWTTSMNTELFQLENALKEKQQEMKQFEGNKAGMPFGKKGFFKEARDMGVVMREDRRDQRKEDGTGPGLLTRGVEGLGKSINKGMALSVGNVASAGEILAKGSASLGMKAAKKLI